MFTEEHCQIIKEGGVGIIPTETVYGIICSALDEDAIMRIYDIKHRDKNKQMIVLVSGPEQLDQFGVWPDDKKKMQEIWQDERPTSIDVFVTESRHKLLTLGFGTIAFRVPKGFEELRQFVECTGPIVAPSANPQGENPATSFEMAQSYFGKTVDFYVDGGDRAGQASKVIRLEKDGSITIKRK